MAGKPYFPQTAAAIVIGVILVASNVAMIARVRRLEEEREGRAAGVNPLVLRKMLSSPSSLTGLEGLSRRNDVRYVVLVVLSPTDCGACLTDLASLNRVTKSRSDVAVVGLVGHSNQDEVAQTTRNFGFSFPMIEDRDSKWSAALGPPKTPWKAVYDLSTRAVVIEDGPAVTVEESEAFLQWIASLAR